MILIPAIDIKDKKCVRLFKGDFDKETIYSNSPKEVSLKWISAGASLIHLVDLDGALTGEIVNLDIISIILLAILLIFASLESFLGFCFGCKVFKLLMHINIIPQDVCEKCNNLEF